MQKTTQGTCSFPGCEWAGQFANYKKHAFGVGKTRRGKHEGCDCTFVPDVALEAEQPTSVLLSALAHLPRDGQSLHVHLQGEFHRRTQMQARIERLRTQSFVEAHDEMSQNKHPVHQSYHDAITTFRAEGKTAFDAANPATLAHLMSSPELPPSVCRQFRCACRCVILFTLKLSLKSGLSKMKKAPIHLQRHCVCVTPNVCWA